MKVVHLITGLGVGGAETMLARLLAAMDRGVRNLVVSLTEPGPLARRIAHLGTPVYTLGMRRGRPSARGLLALTRLLARERPSVLQAWMYHANLLGLLAGWASPVGHVVWNIRTGNVDLKACSRSTAWAIKAGAYLSRWPAAVVVNSSAGRAAHAALGYRPARWEVIPNGFDLKLFAPDPSARESARAELGLHPRSVLVGLVARYDPVKGHETFLRAALPLARSYPDVHFVLVGTEVVPVNAALWGVLEGQPGADSFHLLGERADVPRLLSALDVLASSSTEEGFPNVVGEAMACGVPCVVTDVGDSRAIVGETGVVVRPRDPDALAEGLRRMIESGAEARTALGAAARQRVRENYGLERVAGRYEAFYSSLRGR